jgi:cobalt-precorrin 5A hydrolase
MVGGEAMIVAGIGLRAGASWQDVVELISLAVRTAALSLDDLDRLATLDARANEEGFTTAARHLKLPAIGVPAEAMRAVAPSVRTHSSRVEALHGVGSIAEASALAAAGKDARLLLRRIASTRVTCALAQGVFP